MDGLFPRTSVNLNALLKVYSFTETCSIREVDPMTLESPSKEVINQYVTVNQSTAHPHSDPDGTVYNMGSTFGKETFYNIFKYPGKFYSNTNSFKVYDHC